MVEDSAPCADRARNVTDSVGEGSDVWGPRSETRRDAVQSNGGAGARVPRSSERGEERTRVCGRPSEPCCRRRSLGLGCAESSEEWAENGYSSPTDFFSFSFSFPFSDFFFLFIFRIHI